MLSLAFAVAPLGGRRQACRPEFLRAEDLCAICLDTGRTQDFLRVALFLEQDAVDRAAFREILNRHGLTAKLGQVPNWTP